MWSDEETTETPPVEEKREVKEEGGREGLREGGEGKKRGEGRERTGRGRMREEKSQRKRRLVYCEWVTHELDASYRRTGFKCEHVIIANCDFSPSAQLLERNVYITHSINQYV